MFIHSQFTTPNLIQTGFLSYLKQHKLITNENVNDKYYQDRTALHIAVISNQIEIVDCLLTEFTPNVLAEDSLGLTPVDWIFIKIIQNHNKDNFLYLIKRHSLLNKGINQQKILQKINSIPNDWLNICLAAQLSVKQVQKRLDNNNKNINNNKNNNNNQNIYLKTHFNRKAHHWAAISGSIQMFNLLIQQHKFDPYQQDQFGFNCYHYIFSNINNPINNIINKKNNNIITYNINLCYYQHPNHYEVIIIGSGAAGIGAAMTLSRAGVPYIMLQARNRIGGRLQSKQISGIQIDLGACWVHSCSKNNPIWKQGKKLNWKSKQNVIKYTDPVILSQLTQEYKEQDIHQALILSQQYYTHVNHKALTAKQDIPIQQAGRQYYQQHILKLSPTKRSLVDMFINMTEHYNAAEIQKLSAKYYQQQTDTGGNWLPQGGYYKLVQGIAESISLKDHVRFNKQVKQIIYGIDDKKQQQQKYQFKFNKKDKKYHHNNKSQSQYSKVITTQGQVYYAKHIISSLPLGILKQNKVKFTPQLPKQHQQCITKLGWGVMNKIILSFQQPFWKQNPSWLRIACQQKGRFPGFYNFSTQDKHILCCFVTDKFANKLSKQTDEQILAQLLQLLKKVSINKQVEIKVLDFVITRWDSDPYSLGSYSHFGVGSNMETSKKLRKSIDDKLWIVGEHCYGEHIGCAHGAFQTGIWAGEEILGLIKRVGVDLDIDVDVDVDVDEQ